MTKHSLKLVAVNAVVIVVLLEIALRIFPQFIPPQLLVRFDERLRGDLARGRFQTKADTVVVERDDGGPELRVPRPFAVTDRNFPPKDEAGFCNARGSYGRSSIDIITIGDSFTVCTTVHASETWTSKLSEILGVSTYNLGRGGTGLYEYLQILKKFGLSKSPKVVIMNVYGGNDMRDAIRYHAYRSAKDNRRAFAPEGAIDGIARSYRRMTGRVNEHSYTVNLARATKSWLDSEWVRPSAKKSIDFRYRLAFPDQVVPFNSSNTDVDEVVYAKKLLDGEVDLEQVFGPALDSFVHLARSHSFIPVLTYTPSAYTAYVGQAEFNDPNLKSILLGKSARLRRYFESKGRALGYSYLDFTPHLQSAAPRYGARHLLYFEHNVHLTPAGHVVLAEALGQWLSEVGFVKAPQMARH